MELEKRLTTMFHSVFNSETLYITADLHFGHKNICKGVSNWSDKSKCRDFPDLHSMNKAVLESIVQVNMIPGSDLIIVGDILFGDKKDLINIILYLRLQNVGRILFCLGNHDDYIRKNPEYQALFDWCGDYLEIFVKRPDGSKKMCCISHYPMKSWRDMSHGSYMISGHCHGTLEHDPNEKIIDVGWDVWHKSLSFNEIDKMLKNRRFTPKDHHTTSSGR